MSKENQKGSPTVTLGPSAGGGGESSPRKRDRTPFYYVFVDYIPGYSDHYLTGTREEERLKKFEAYAAKLAPQDDLSFVRKYLPKHLRNMCLISAMHYSPKYMHFAATKRAQKFEHNLIGANFLLLFGSFLLGFSFLFRGASWLQNHFAKNIAARKLVTSAMTDDMWCYIGLIAGSAHINFLLDSDYTSYKFDDPQFKPFYENVAQELFNATYTPQDYKIVTPETDESYEILKKLGLTPYSAPAPRTQATPVTPLKPKA